MRRINELLDERPPPHKVRERLADIAVGDELDRAEAFYLNIAPMFGGAE